MSHFGRQQSSKCISITAVLVSVLVMVLNSTGHSRPRFQDFVYGDTWKDLVCQQKVEKDVLLHHIFVAMTCVKDISNKLAQTIRTVHTHIRLCTEAEGNLFQNELKLEQYKFEVINCLYLFL